MYSGLRWRNGRRNVRRYLKRHGVMKCAPLLLVMIAGAPAVNPAVAQNVRPVSIDSLRSIGLDSIDGVAIAYFRPADRARAVELQSLLGEYLAYYHDQAGVQSRMRVAVLNREDWSRLSQIPYGLPNNSGPGAGNVLLAATAPPERVGARTLPRGRLVNFLVIGHEGGHLLTWELMPTPMRSAMASSDSFPTNLVARFRNVGQVPTWYWELVANFFTTAFLEASHSDDAKAWLEHLKEISAIDRPRFTHLSDWFGRLLQATAPDSTPYIFSAEGGRNQGWYQGVVGQMAAYIHSQSGLRFIDHVRSVVSGDSVRTTPELVLQLDSIAPGASALLRDLGAQWARQDSTVVRVEPRAK
jgi:hypothetical protein